MSSSLDNFFHDPTDANTLSEEQRKKFEEWMSRILVDPERISSMIEKALHEGMHSEWEEESIQHKFKVGSYYPSMIEHCLRQQAYTYTSPIPPSKEDLAILGEGRAIHELVAMALRRSGLISIEGREVVVELEFGEGAKLHGRIDDLLLIRLTDGDSEDFRLFIPLEIKSISALPEKPRESHYYQLSTYLLARKFPMGVLLYWAKRGGGVKAFSIPRDDVMQSVLRERVLELHEALTKNLLPQKEASINRDFIQCERCAYSETCNPFLIEKLPKASQIALFDIDSVLLDSLPRRRAAMKELGLSPSLRASDIHDKELREKFWELYNSPKYAELDVLIEQGKLDFYKQLELGRAPVGISSARHDNIMEATRARLANLEIPLAHLIVRESGNYDTDIVFKTKWVLRLEGNYEIVEYFDRDALVSSEILKSIRRHRQKKSEVSLEQKKD
ncbi:MAG: PD-(D/E)XK nuclease family protein [archaeon]|nr:PD-(D/E)XK nuclease family protein [archaeon]